MKLTASNITSAGNAVGFNSKGQTIVASKKRKQSLTTVKVWIDIEGVVMQNQVKTFGDTKTALDYINSILDLNKTAELAWW